MVPGILLFTFLGFFTLQESGLFNVFNFFVVTLVVLSLFAAFTLSEISQKKTWWSYALVLFFILVTVPRVFFEMGSFIKAYRDGSYRLISNAELEALTFIREESDPRNIVQSHPENSLDSVTPYVSYFTNRETFYTGGGLLVTHNQPVEKREKTVEEIFTQPNVTEFSSALRDAGIQYVYLRKKDEEKLPFGEEPPHLTTIFENDEVIVYQAFRE